MSFILITQPGMGLLQRGAWARAVDIKQTNSKQRAPHITVLHVQKKNVLGQRSDF